MLGWFAIVLAGALGVRAHVRAVSSDNARRAAARAPLATPQGQSIMRAASDASLFVLNVGPRT